MQLKLSYQHFGLSALLACKLLQTVKELHKTRKGERGNMAPWVKWPTLEYRSA